MRTLCFLALCLGLAIPSALGLSASNPLNVLVTGASGRTGQLVLNLLLNDDRFNVKALVRSEQSAKKLRKLTNIGLEQIIVCDVVTELEQKPPSGLDGIHSMVVCTSAVPRISKWSLAKALLAVPWNVARRRRAIDFRNLQFRWQDKQYPELVDYNGQVAQVEVAKRRQMRHIVLVSSMGGTDPDNFLNAVGKTNGKGHGDILVWKRKAEKYLIESGLDYTIIHPGGLNDKPGGVEDYRLDVDDKLYRLPKRSICREDVARLCVASLATWTPRTRRSFDCITEPSENPTSPEQALDMFRKSAKTYTY